jgi:hypothetical protein
LPYHGEHAVVLGFADQIDLLRTPYGGGGQILVHARYELHVVGFQMAFGLPDFHRGHRAANRGSRK